MKQGFLQKAQKSRAEHEFKGRAKRQATLKCGWTSKCGCMLGGVGETGAGWGLVPVTSLYGTRTIQVCPSDKLPTSHRAGKSRAVLSYLRVSSCSCLGSFHDSQGAAASQERAPQGVSFSRKKPLPLCEAAKGPLLGSCVSF